MGYSEKTQQTTGKDTTDARVSNMAGRGNFGTALTVAAPYGRAATFWTLLTARHGPKGRNIISDHALL